MIEEMKATMKVIDRQCIDGRKRARMMREQARDMDIAASECERLAAEMDARRLGQLRSMMNRGEITVEEYRKMEVLRIDDIDSDGSDSGDNEEQASSEKPHLTVV